MNLLEAEPAGPEIVAAYAQLAATRSRAAAFREGIAAAERALALAAELGLPEPARALGYLGMARVSLGDGRGLQDMRRALGLAIEQGQGPKAAVLHNNLAYVLWQHEGSEVALRACREGIDFCGRRGIAEFARFIAGTSTTFLAEGGRTEQALTEAAALADRLQTSGDVTLTEPRSVQLRLLAERGAHRQAPATEELVASARTSGEAQTVAMAFAAAARLLLAQRQTRPAHALLTELEQQPGTRADPCYASWLPELVRTALALGDRALAGRLVDGIEPITPVQQHALADCHALLAEAAGNDAEAPRLFERAAVRWREFGNVPERAYALLGQGRCLRALDDPDAEMPLRQARELFASMQYKGALVETELLLAQAAAASAS